MYYALSAIGGFVLGIVAMYGLMYYIVKKTHGNNR
jgi:hypothetical protein